ALRRNVRTERHGPGASALQFRHGRGIRMPADPDLLPILRKLALKGARWQVTAIGRAEVWRLHRRAAELGGDLRTGLEDTFYLPDGSKASSNGPLVEMLASHAREAGRAVASPAEAREMLGLVKQAA